MRTALKNAFANRKQSRIAVEIANAVAYLHAADAKLGFVADELDGDGKSWLDEADVTQARLTARAMARMLNAGGTSTVSRRVLDAIEGHANHHWRNQAHVEGSIIALKLAGRSLEAALDLAHQLDGDEISPAFETPFAAWCIVREVLSMLESLTLYFDHDDAMESILGGENSLAIA